MAVSEYERTQLFVWFEEHMGKERASTMMNLLPPVGWGDVATRRDLELLEDKLDNKIDRLVQRLDSRIDALEIRLDSMAATMATKQDLADLRAELQRTLVTWIFASQATVVAAIGVLLAVLR
jgi:cytochrome P450